MKKQILGLFSAAFVLCSFPIAQATPQQEATDAFRAFEKNYSALSLSEIVALFPASQQQIFTDCTRMFAEFAGKEVWSAGRKALYTISATGVKQAHMLLNDPQYDEMISQAFNERLEGSPYENLTKKQKEAVFVHVFATLGALAQNATYENVRTKPIAEILRVKPLSMAGVTDKLPTVSSIVDKPEAIKKTTVVSDTKVEFTVDSASEPVTFVKVDGKWIPEDFYLTREDVAEIKTGIQSRQLNNLQKNTLVNAFRTVADMASAVGTATDGESLTKIVQQQKPKLFPILMQLSMAFSEPGSNAIEADDEKEDSVQ
ncbi:MAG: hypothetical protein ACI4QT_01575 [Kiritimatiellia bacterium]